MGIWSKGMLRIFNASLIVNGSPPKPPFFLVSNHLSYFDIIVYYNLIQTTFVAKADVRSWPVLGFLIKTMGVIFIDRTKRRDVKRVNKLISSNINEYQGVVLFPEGTTSPGFKVMPFRPSLLQYPASKDIPVHFSVIRYETKKPDPPACSSICWWGDSEFMEHFWNMAKLRSVRITVIFGDESIHSSDRKELAIILNKCSNDIFDPICKPEEVKDFAPPKFLNIDA